MSSYRPWSSQDKPGELATSMGRGRGRQKVTRGVGMVTPREPLVQTENGRSEELIHGRHRFSRDYPLVREHPEWFRPCDPEDIETIRRHRELAERKLRHLGGTTTRADARSRRKFSLAADRPRREFRLP
jgi:hypothetical protein